MSIRALAAVLGTRRALAFFLALAVILAATGIGLSVNGRGPAGLSAALADPLAILAGRSPGARAEGALTQTKPSRVLTNQRHRPFRPSERVLTSMRYRPPVLPPIAFDAPPALVFDTPAGGGEPLATPRLFIPTAFGPGTGLPSVPDSGVGGGGPPIVTAVPEPATWVMLIGGFFAIGASLRRQRARARASTARIL